MSTDQEYNNKIEFHKHEPNTVTFMCGGDVMLKINATGFYVRGNKVEVDDKEAEQVYNSFKAWLTWQQLNR
jgi:hypothetical protein